MGEGIGIRVTGRIGMSEHIVILYGSKTKLSKGHFPAMGATARSEYYIRMETVKASDLGHALDQAKPRPCEVVLNSVYANPKPSPALEARICQ